MAVVGIAEVEVTANTNKFEKDVKNLGGATSATGGIFSKFQGVIGKAEGALGRLGITSQQLAVVMGAGLAGGAAFAAREIIQFVAESIKAAADLGEQVNQSRVLFGQASSDVERFAKGAVNSFGLSERAALQAAGAFGGIGKSIGLSEGSLDDFSVTLVKIAGDLASFKNISTEEAIQKLTSGLVGQTETLRELGIIIDQDTLKRAAQREKIGDGSKELSQQEKVLATYSEILRQSSDAQGDFARTSDSLPNQLRSFEAQVENLKASLGEGLLPVVVDAVGSLSDFVFLIEKAADGIAALVGAAPDDFSLADLIPGANERRLLGDLVDKLKGTDKEAGKLASTSELLAGGLNKAEKAAEDAADATDKLADAHKRLNRAIEDSERRVDQAEITLARAFEDSELRIDKAERALAEAYEDRSENIADAEEKLADARKDAAQAIEDAEKRLADVRVSTARDVRQARERLRDFQIDSAKRVANAERELVEVREERVRAIADAQIALERAAASGDADAENEAARQLAAEKQNQSVADAERDLAEEKKNRDEELDRLERDLAEAKMDRQKQLAEAEKDLAEVRIDAADRIGDAQRDLARTVEDSAERIIDAQRAIEEAHRDSQRAIADAQRGLADAQRQGAEAVDDASVALDRLGEKAGDAAEKVDVLNDQMVKLRDILLDPVFTDRQSLGEGDGTSLDDILLNERGGTIPPGRWSWVGEDGPELVRSGGGSYVTSNDDIVAVLRQMSQNGGSSGAGVTQHISVSGVDPRVLVNELRFMLMQGVTS